MQGTQGWRRVIVPVTAGLILAGLAVLVMILNPAQGRLIHAVVLAAIGLIYIYFGLAEGWGWKLGLQIAIALGFLLLALLGYRFSLYFLAVGYLAHGLWDTVNQPHGLYRTAPGWYAPFCMAYDWLIALAILILA